MTDLTAIVKPADLQPILGPVHTLCPHKSCADIRAQHASDQRIIWWLLSNIDAIRQDETAPHIHRSILRLAARVERAVDNRDPDVYCGPCDGPVVEADEVDGEITLRVVPDATCGADLYCHLEDKIVSCVECGTAYPVAEVQAYMLDEAREQWARPRAIVGLLRGMGMEITLDKLANWTSRDKAERDAGRIRRVPYPPILQVGIDDDGKALFRLGDVMGRIEALGELAEAKKSMSA